MPWHESTNGDGTMLQTTWIAIVLGFWSSLYLLDVFLKTRRWSSRSYLGFLESSGLSVSICQLRWYSTWFNRLFLRIAQWKPRLLRFWFTLGVFFALAAMLMSVFLLSLLVLNTVLRQPVEQQVLTPVMPGINLPSGQITYYLFTLLLCGILHEMGHAVAAIREQVRVNGFGIFMLLVYPGAYVDLSTEHLQIISPLRQLRIYCAGVWHNFIIVLVAVIFLLFLPWILIPFYGVGDSVIITQIVEKYACLPARSTSDRPPCNIHSDCFTPTLDMSCVIPALDNTTKLLRVYHGRKPPLLFLGHPLDLHYSLSFSNYVPLGSFIPINLPYILETLCKYLISLSGALIILNVVPCYALDGQWICHAFIELALRSTIADREVRAAIYTIIILFGTALLLTNVIIAMLTLFL